MDQVTLKVKVHVRTPNGVHIAPLHLDQHEWLPARLVTLVDDPTPGVLRRHRALATMPRWLAAQKGWVE